MTKDECDKLIEELYSLVDEGPNASRKPWAMSRVEAIAREFQRASSDTYVNEKRATMVRDFEVWFAPRKWQQWGKDGTQFRAILSQSIHKLQGAMDSLEARTGTKAYS